MPFKDRQVAKKYLKEYHRKYNIENAAKLKKYRQQYIKLHPRTEYHRKWANVEGNKKRLNSWAKDYRQKRKLMAWNLIGHGLIECERCGCNVANALSINHKNGDGKIDRDKYGGSMNTQFHTHIIKGKRKYDDLNLLCMLCNWAEFIEKKYGIKYKIKINGKYPRNNRRAEKSK